jgi:Zn-dependent protease with chaperone function
MKGYFAAASTDIRPSPSSPKLSGRKLYLCLPFLRVLSREDLMAIVAHELGHFKGHDTLYSSWFVPQFRSIGITIQRLSAHAHTRPLRTLLLIPTVGILRELERALAFSISRINRLREFEADKIAATATSPQAIAKALARITVLCALANEATAEASKAFYRGVIWRHLHEWQTRRALLVDCRLGSTSGKRMLATALGNSRLPHPTDTHPPLTERFAALGQNADDLACSIDYDTADDALFDLPGNLPEADYMETMNVQRDFALSAAISDQLTHPTAELLDERQGRAISYFAAYVCNSTRGRVPKDAEALKFAAQSACAHFDPLIFDYLNAHPEQIPEPEHLCELYAALLPDKKIDDTFGVLGTLFRDLGVECNTELSNHHERMRWHHQQLPAFL